LTSIGHANLDPLGTTNLDRLPHTAQLWLALELEGADLTRRCIISEQGLITGWQWRVNRLSLCIAANTNGEQAQGNHCNPGDQQGWKGDSLKHNLDSYPLKAHSRR
jgi:hypothetical protein